jgi:hypothetical protein
MTATEDILYAPITPVEKSTEADAIRQEMMARIRAHRAHTDAELISNYVRNCLSHLKGLI